MGPISASERRFPAPDDRSNKRTRNFGSKIGSRRNLPQDFASQLCSIQATRPYRRFSSYTRRRNAARELLETGERSRGRLL